MLSTMSQLKVQPTKSKGLAFIIKEARKLSAPPPLKKAQFSVPKMKQVAKLAKTLGQEITGYTVNGDGGFTVTTGTPGITTAAQSNEWD